MNLIVRTEQLNTLNKMLRDGTLSDMTSSHKVFPMYGFEYFHVTLSVTIHPDTSAVEMRTLLLEV